MRGAAVSPIASDALFLSSIFADFPVQYSLPMKADLFLADVASKPPFSKMPPQLAGFFKSYLAGEKIVEFNGQYVINTHFPPYPSGAFNNTVLDCGSATATH